MTSCPWPLVCRNALAVLGCDHGAAKQLKGFFSGLSRGHPSLAGPYSQQPEPRASHSQPAQPAFHAPQTTSMPLGLAILLPNCMFVGLVG